MHTVMDVNEYARWYYRGKLVDGEPTKSQTNVVRRKCQDGTIKHAEKMGSKWFIDCTAEWPKVFPDPDEAEPRVVYVERPPVITADMKVGDALAVLLGALAEGKEASNA